ncbi:MAG: hypothetical protein OI74_11720 [Gammaproteobacteria bacterium (ex Lamellibrachia satsuma)]|nr:MAG: SUMF1/EgtB/PvdO family nonheme iron enzyme [Gammaproteobacteria bacterium (ex Lamellibrachia satsuma)]RRS32393.1 MAG: hypothetical protein OI74_11720 [Gammaproteobacteria bacterium (ex Lamellibrachia satsuma)]RRS35288.1 MAG: hypothetical protein NV67_11055 [Gammaproteobacteria bacterium (ex Lamellibrachia satsuma)]
MTWLQPTGHEEYLLQRAEETEPDVVELAKLLSLVTLVEPLLLRNVRRHFLPSSETETESRLWFSNLVSVRSTRGFILHQGVARLLADELLEKEKKRFQKLWRFTQDHTAHWKPLERLERDLRCYTVKDELGEVRKRLQDILRDISKERDEEKRLDMARWAKKNLPLVATHENALEESHLLAQYAATALSDTADWSTLSQPQSLPTWLKNQLPEPFANTKISLQLHFDDKIQTLVLNCLEPTLADATLELQGPLPARLHIQPEGQAGKWEVFNIGTRIRLPELTSHILITTIDGRQFELDVEKQLKSAISRKGQSSKIIYLAHVDADTTVAEKLSEWLAMQNIQVEPLLERPGETPIESGESAHKVIRLWSESASQAWGSIKQDFSLSLAQALLLRTGNAAFLSGMNKPQNLIDMPDLLQDLGNNKIAAKLKDRLDQWLSGADEPQNEIGSTETGTQYNEEIQALLDEIDDTLTPPKRRLEIGDLLAKLGDPRPGVGVYEATINIPPETENTKPRQKADFNPEVQKLLDELNNIETPSERRLKIGDELAELSDPRPGVGLDDDNLPDIDWVEIPAGEFLYGEEKERRTSDLFYISRYPVTNVQYRAFIVAGGYESDRWWYDLDKPPKPEKSKWEHHNRPRTNVDWYEAIAFSRWLAEMRNMPIRLATEAEWEKAARGSDGRAFPWGEEYINGYANVDESSIKGRYLEQTTIVGLYPQGASPYGVMDMTGNVWEWCLNKYIQPNLIEADNSGDDRVLRGGSWLYGPNDARADYRGRGHPVYRLYIRGFRLLLPAPISGR